MKNRSKPTDGDFITQLYQQYHYDVLKLIKMKCISSSKQDQEELLQEVFLCALKKRKELETHSNPIGWLALTAMNCTYAFNRKLTKKMRDYEKYAEKRMPQQPVEEKVEIRMENKANAISQQEALKSVLDALTDLEYNLYVLYYCHHLPYSEIAKQLSMKESYVDVRIHRLNRKLKLLAKNFFEEKV